MDLLPKTLGTRPRLAVEIRPEGVVAARAEDAQALVSAASFGVFEEGTLAPGLRAGNIVARRAAIAAVKKALEAVALKERQVTVVMPDAAAGLRYAAGEGYRGAAGGALPAEKAAAVRRG
jgi:type IV pilus assembly protein PilM